MRVSTHLVSTKVQTHFVRGAPRYPDSTIKQQPAYIAEPYGDYIVKCEDKAIIIFPDELGIWHNSRMM